MERTVKPFRNCAVTSGLVTMADLDDAAAALRAKAVPVAGKAPGGVKVEVSDKELAEQLIRVNKLTRYQAEQLLAGRTKLHLSQYRILESIGRGGMGEVFKAEHLIMGRTVAVKVLPRSKSTPDAIASFMHEIRAQAKLHHENLVQAFDAGHDGNVYFLVTEYVPGTDLRKHVRARGALGMREAATIISQAAKGLDSAHKQGLIHRDVKPGNLLVTPEGLTKVSDLGLAGWLNDTEADPRAGKIVGTADYLAPEQILSPREVTPASDVYALGCTLYYAVTGKVPFAGGTTRDKAKRHLEDTPLHPRRLNAELSDDFVEVIADMMDKVPSRRMQTAAEVIARLKPWAGENATGIVEASTDKRLPPKLPGRIPNIGPRDLLSVEDDGGEEFPGLADTDWQFDDGHSQVSQGTEPFATADEETVPVVHIGHRPAYGRAPLPVWAIPLGLAGLAGAIGLLVLLLNSLSK